MKEKKRVFSGVQPSGDPQLGNYLGAFKGWVDRQSEKENFFCVVDLHALTATPDPVQLVSQTRDLAAILFACGLDPQKSTLFVQSHVPAHAEGCWLLNCVTPLGWLERITGNSLRTIHMIGGGTQNRLLCISLELIYGARQKSVPGTRPVTWQSSCSKWMRYELQDKATVSKSRTTNTRHLWTASRLKTLPTRNGSCPKS